MSDFARTWLQDNVIPIMGAGAALLTAGGVVIGHVAGRSKVRADANLSDAQAAKTLSEIKPPEAYALKNTTDTLEMMTTTLEAMTKILAEREQAALQRDHAATDREERHLVEISGLRREILRLEDNVSELKGDFVAVCSALLVRDEQCGDCPKRMPIPEALVRRARELVAIYTHAARAGTTAAA